LYLAAIQFTMLCSWCVPSNNYNISSSQTEHFLLLHWPSYHA